MSSIAAPRFPTKELRALLQDAGLPTMPQATLRIMELASDPFTSLEHVSTAVATDPALSGRVLGLANSALYSRGTKFETVGRAVSHLGVMRIRSLAMALHLFSSKPSRQDQFFNYAWFWRYCLTCAVAAKVIAQREKEVDPDEAFVTALLQHIGVLALQQAHPREYARIFDSKARSKVRLHEKELEVWGYDHADVGAAVAAHWGLPRQIGSAILLHHRPGDHALANLCHFADLVHAAIYESTEVSVARRAEQFRAQVRDGDAILLNVEIELPHIAEACSCPDWTSSTEEELKERIAQLVGADTNVAKL